jgi:hypothetical protein
MLKAQDLCQVEHHKTEHDLPYILKYLGILRRKAPDPDNHIDNETSQSSEAQGA